MKQITVLLLLLSPFFTHSQKRLELVHHNAFAFYDYQEKAFCVLDDSSFIWKYDAKKEKWVTSPIELRIDKPFNKFLSEFIPMSDKGTPVYFVHAGCGVVYAKNGALICRHDHSFYHMNQFGGAFFMDQGEPRIYGGYGLFTSKSIITCYDTIEKEWFLMNTSKAMPPEGTNNILIKDAGNYYVFDGIGGTAYLYDPFTDVWRLDLHSKKWKNIGRLNPNCHRKQEENGELNFHSEINHFVFYMNSFIEYDFQRMTYTKYKFSETGLIKNIIQVGKKLLVCKSSSNPSTVVEIKDIHYLNEFDKETGAILLDESKHFPWGWMLLGIIIVIAFGIIVRFRLKRKGIKTEEALDGGKNATNIVEFNQTELQLIELLLKYQEVGLEISYINDLVNHDQPAMDTLKKRRELLLKDLRFKLATKFQISQEEVFTEQRMETDKRMKLIFLNEKLSKRF